MALVSRITEDQNWNRAEGYLVVQLSYGDAITNHPIAQGSEFCRFSHVAGADVNLCS